MTTVVTDGYGTDGNVGIGDELFHALGGTEIPNADCAVVVTTNELSKGGKGGGVRSAEGVRGTCFMGVVVDAGKDINERQLLLYLPLPPHLSLVRV